MTSSNRVPVRRLAGAFLLLAALAAPAAPAAAQTPDSVQAAATVPATAPAALSLEEALNLAGAASEQVGIARAGVQRARGDQQRARSELFPQLTGTASYVRTLASQFGGFADDEEVDPVEPPAPASCSRFTANPALPIGERVDSLESSVGCLSAFNPFAAFEDLPFGRTNQYSFGLQASQTLFAGGRVRGQTRIAGAGRRRAELELTSQQAQLVLDVTQAYYDAALSDRLLGIAEATLSQAERTLQNTTLARRVGNAPEFDQLRAQVARDNQRPVVIQRRAQRDIAYLRLKQLLNLPLERPLALTTSLGDTVGVQAAPQPVSVPAKLVAEGAADTAVAARAGVRQAEAGLEASEGQLAVARSQLYPQLTLSSSYARLAYPEDGIPGWNDFVNDWTVTVGIRWPLFTGGRIAGERTAARAGVEEARLRLQQTRELAALDARNAAAQLEAADALWAASTGTVEQATRAYDIAEVRYREGISTQTELSDSRILLQQALANRAQAARDLQVARVRIALLRDLPLGGASQAFAQQAAASAAAAAAAAGTLQSAPPAPQQGGASPTLNANLGGAR